MKLINMKVRNKYFILAIFAIVFVTAIPLPALATCTSTSGVSATATPSVSTVTTGTSVSVGTSISVTTSCSADSITLVSSPSGVSISDPATGSYTGVSLTNTPTTANSFTITASTDATYSVYVSVDGLSTTESTIVFVKPDTLQVSGSPSSVSASGGDTVTITISITNPPTSSGDVTSSWSISAPSGVTLSGDATSSSGTNFVRGQTRTYSWVATLASGISSGSKPVTFALGSNSNAFTAGISVPAAAGSSSSSSSGSSSGGVGGVGVSGGKLVEEAGKAIITASSIAKNGNLRATLTPTTDVGIEEFFFGVVNTVTNIRVTTEKLAAVPSSVTAPPGEAYRLIKITKENMTNSDINIVRMNFTVTKAWLADKKADTVTLYHSESGTSWDKYTTEKISESSTSVTYKAEGSALSYFAITAEKVAVAPTAPPEETGISLPGNVTIPSEIDIPGFGKVSTQSLVLGIILLVVGIYFLYKWAVAQGILVHETSYRRRR